MKCCFCGEEIQEDALFCPLCGGKQQAAPVEPEKEITLEPVEEVEEAPAAEPAKEPEEEPVAQAQYEYVPQPAQTSIQAPVRPVYYAASTAPRYQLPDRRGLLKMIFLGLITGGIYNMVIMSRIPEETNMVASRHDGQRTQQYFWAAMLAGLTLGIYGFVWIHGLCNRIGGELKRRGVNYKFSAATFWLWNILGVLLFGIGPLVFTYKLCKASNLMNRDYNLNG